MERHVLRILACLLCAPPSVRAAEPPLRLVLPPVPDSRSLAEGDTFTPIIALYLRERLAACSAVRLVTDKRANAILSNLTSGARRVDEAKRVAEFSRFTPVDAILQMRFAEGKVLLVLHTKAGPQTLSYDAPDASQSQAAMHTLAADLGQALGLPASDLQRLKTKRIAAPDVFHAVYYTRVVSVKWPRNSFEPRLKDLRHVLRQHPRSPALAARILEDAAGYLNAKNRDQSFAKSASTMVPMVLPHVLGTPLERSAHEIARLLPEPCEKDLLALAEPVLADGMELDALDGGDELPTRDPRTGPFDPTQASEAQRLGALRVLGAMHSAKGLRLVLRAAKHDKTAVRAAAAAALRFYPQDAKTLRSLLKDKEETVAWPAAWSLFAQGERSAVLAKVARQMLAQGRMETAVTMLAAVGQKQDAEALRQHTTQAQAAVRRHAWLGLLRLQALAPKERLALLDQPDEELVLAATATCAKGADAATVTRLKGLANDPLACIAEAARRAVATYRPKELEAAALFDLEVEHNYIRERILTQLAAGKNAAVLLKQACANPDHYVRAKALLHLVRTDAKAAHAPLLAALDDPYAWVRLHAASLLVPLARADDAATLQRVRKAEADPAIQLYLDDCLAKIGAAQPPAVRPAARSIEGKTGLTWLCSSHGHAKGSPFQAYYALNVNVDDMWRKTYETGKIYFGRAHPTSSPGADALDITRRDQTFAAFDQELNETNLPYLDGIILGEESMSFATDRLWDKGWRLFCLDAGIPPGRINGDREKLNAYEKAAFHRWGLERHIDGFNRLYDYVKLRFGRLRPGLQVATFMPKEELKEGANPADLRWKFDVAGIYDYKGCNRIAAYMLVRRIQTLWPKRPIIWLSLGIGGYEMNPVRFNTQMPTGPLLQRSRRCYADTISAHLAGADVGWFSTWIFVAHNWKGGMGNLAGVQIRVEDIAPPYVRVKQGIEYAFRNTRDRYLAVLQKPMKPGDALPGDNDEDGLGQLEDPDKKKDPIAEKMAADKARMLAGFGYWGKYVHDCARLFVGMPRRRYRASALVVRPGITVWTRGTNNALVPGFALLNAFDFLCDINKAPAVGLERYRLIAVHDPGPLTDTTIAALSRWLQTTPGLLYVHQDLAAGNHAEFSTTADHDGRLSQDWPWEKDVQIVRAPTPKDAHSPKPAKLTLADAQGDTIAGQGVVSATFTVGKEDARVLLQHQGQPVLVLWTHPAYSGAVLFDGVSLCTGAYLEALRTVINEIHTKHRIGLPLKGAVLQQVLRLTTGLGVASSGYYRGASSAATYEGVDLLTGERNPSVGPGRSGAMLFPEHTAPYVICHKGVAVLAETPLTVVERLDNGVKVRAAGIVRAASATGRVQVLAEDQPLPRVDMKDMAAWFFQKRDPGQVALPIGEAGKGGTVAFVRSRKVLTITTRE